MESKASNLQDTGEAMYNLGLYYKKQKEFYKMLKYLLIAADKGFGIHELNNYYKSNITKQSLEAYQNLYRIRNYQGLDHMIKIMLNNPALLSAHLEETFIKEQIISDQEHEIEKLNLHIKKLKNEKSKQKNVRFLDLNDKS
jgi:hypothetical protein